MASAASAASGARRRPVFGRRPGSLVVIGSGISAIGQFTLEAAAHLRRADVAFFNVSDPATEQWIVEQNPRAVDLFQLYANDKPRWTTYVQMAELMLRPMRQGLDVVGVFYGHPGVFVASSRRAIAIARQEGHAARMLPAVSAIDCLFADLGVDPAAPGCQIVGATDLLLRRRPLLTESNVVILQVGSVGDAGFQYAGHANSHLAVLVRYLQDAYGRDHELVHYVAAGYPGSQPTIERYRLSDLLRSEVRARIDAASTFYLPPAGERPTDLELAGVFGLTADIGTDADAAASAASSVAYSPRELDAIAELDKHRPPPEYRPTRPSPALYGLIADLALEPALLDRFEADPELVLRSRPDLTTAERAAVVSGNPGWLNGLMRPSEAEVARNFVRRVLSDTETARRYHELLQAGLDEPGLARGLADLGCDTSPAEVLRTLDELIQQDLRLWAGRYELAVEGRRRGALTITPSGAVLLDGTPVVAHRFEGGALSWSEPAGNRCSARLRLLLTDPDGQPLPPEAYVGPLLCGELWDGAAAGPGRDNAFGKVGVYSADCIADPLAADPLALWEGEYATRLSTPEGTWLAGPRIAVLRPGDAAGAVEVLVDGRPAGDWTYAQGALSWIRADGSWSGSVLFHWLVADEGPRLVGRVWVGQGQPAAAMNCVGRRVTRRG